MPVAPVVVDHPLLAHKLTLMRRRETPSSSFRALMREAGAILDLATVSVAIETPIGPASMPALAAPLPVLVSILRAGNALVDGMLDLMPFASVGHIGLYRDHDTLEAHEYYFHMPSGVADRPVILADPMLATANSAR